VWLAVRVDLTAGQRAELRALTMSTEVSAAVGTRARIVLWILAKVRLTQINIKKLVANNSK
jgi:hypothetical protein